MRPLSGKPTSLWMDTAPGGDPVPLDGDRTADVAILGGGLTGLTAGLLLARAGMEVALVEASRVAAGVTGYTTAKVTSLHGLVYDSLLSGFGEEGARAYGDANQAAIERIAGFVEEGIDCDFRRKAAYTYAETSDGLGEIEAEVDAAIRLGLPASYATETTLPFPVAGAVRFADQAEFHPRRYALGLVELLRAEGARVFEGTRALGVSDGSPCRVRTDRGTVTAHDVIVATHYPILDRGLLFARISPERSYVLGVTASEPIPDGMFLSTESPSHSIRAHPVEGGEMLLIGGESHKVGQSETAERYRALEDWARERFEVSSVDYRWSAQDNMPVDGMPFVGRLTPLSSRLHVATGFHKWGMTNGTAAGMMLCDEVLGRPNPWARAFTPNRLKPLASAKKLVKENANAGWRFVADRAERGSALEAPEELAPGEGRIARIAGRKMGAYRDDEGVVHAVSPVCTHLQCHVKWNSAERTWDCPCHGSRYSHEGRVLQGPAVRDLEYRRISD